jgi:hypothetical protein
MNMKRILVFALPVIVFSASFFSCDSTKTPQEYLREEKKAIERYIDQNGIVVLNNYPADSTFKEKEYFRTNDGLYFHVTDPGTGNKARMGNEVCVRFDYFFDIKNYVGGDTTKSTLSYTYLPIVFRYGISGSYDAYYACNGWAIPLTYVKEGAIIDLIIPSALGSQSNSNSYRPIFYKSLHYTKFK